MDASEAIEARDSQRLRDLVEKNDPSVTSPDAFGQCPIHNAAECGAVECLTVLLDAAKVSVDTADDSHRTALHFACIGGDAPCVMLLLGHGASVDERDSDGASPLHYLAKHGHAALLRDVIEHCGPNVDVDPCDNFMWTPLHFAALNKRVDVAEVLLSKGASRTAKDGRGRTPDDIAKEKEFILPMISP